MKISDLIRRSWQTAEDKGWHDRPRSFRTYETLFHTEVSEYAEEVRKASSPVYDNWDRALDPQGTALDPETMVTPEALLAAGWLPKPEGLAVELADRAIRWGDYLGTVRTVEGTAVADIVGDEHTTERVVQDFLSQGEPEDIVSELSLDEPMDYAAAIHRQIAMAFMELEAGRVDAASEDMGALLPMVLIMFAHKGWDFNAVFERKMAYNSRRPYRHGGKAV